jgi:hypothetical protein
MSWKMVKMSDADVSRQQPYRLQTQFSAVFTTALAPKDAAMFGNKNPKQDDHIFYFSPKAAEIFSLLLAAFSPVDCAAPLRESVSLLVGHSDAFDMLNSNANKAGK